MDRRSISESIIEFKDGQDLDESPVPVNNVNNQTLTKEEL